ncbi:MAG TPA: RNA polymerase sigma factor [Streptosporangiaceae bacterium]
METDGVLIERSARGRPDAFVEVVRRHEVAVHAFLARRAGRQAADDLLGEVWVRAFGGRAGFDPAHSDARPWLYGIARNVLRAHWRAVRPVAQLGGAEATDPAGRAADLATVGAWAVDPWDDVIDRLDSAAAARTREMAGAVRALPPEEREVLLLVAWEQLTPTQAALILGIPPGTARSRLHRARAALRPVLAREGS